MRKTCDECISDVTDVNEHISRSAERNFGKMKKKTHHRESHTTVKDNKITYVKGYK